MEQQPQMSRIEPEDSAFAVGMIRPDIWRQLLERVQQWQHQTITNEVVLREFAKLANLETFYAFPGPQLLAQIEEAIEEDDSELAETLISEVSLAILTRDYKSEDYTPNEFQLHSEDRERKKQIHHNRPYFEVLVVASNQHRYAESLLEDFMEQRRNEDDFIYEIVYVESYQDAYAAVILNGNINSVIIYDNIDYEAKHPVPFLLPALTHLDGQVDQTDEAHLALQLVDTLSHYRPELDLYLVSDRYSEEVSSDERAQQIRRIIYASEDVLDLHLSILEGIRDRYQTPFFDNLKEYTKRPISTFHALPIARGKSIFNSDWISDMGEFYDKNLFLAESSATTGGLDSLLEPTGNIKIAQEKAARAFGADHCYFVTNGTSTYNKIVLMAIAKPGDIIVVDRNCHKSHHYAMVLGGLKPYYVEAYPMKEYSMYGAVPLIEIKRALLNLKREGKLDRVKAVDLTNCTFDGHVYNTRRVMEECLAIKPDLVFLWDEAWFGFAHWSPFLRPRTAMGAAEDIEYWLQTAEAEAAYRAQQLQLGENPNEEVLLNTRLIPNPKQVKIRVYQTNSTHKSLSALRQASMILVKDVQFYAIEPQLKEAIFTHATTSPNQQIIATLDLARRQMELEGYRLVSNALQIALDIRAQIANHPVIAKYFSILTPAEMIPPTLRSTGYEDYFATKDNWHSLAQSIAEDEFFLDPTRMTLVCGRAGLNGTEFKNLLADRFNIQVNKTSRNSILIQSNINNTRSDVAHLINVLLTISLEIEEQMRHSGPDFVALFEEKVANLMEDVPDLPNFSHFAPQYREDVAGAVAVEGDIRTAFFASWDIDQCDYMKLCSEECDQRLMNGPEMISAKMVIPYPPGFPILVPGQVITQDAIDFMRKLDVKEIHGYDEARGLQLIQSTHKAD